MGREPKESVVLPHGLNDLGSRRAFEVKPQFKEEPRPHNVLASANLMGFASLYPSYDAPQAITFKRTIGN